MDQKLSNLINAVSIKDVLSQTTELRPETASVVEKVVQNIRGTDFHEERDIMNPTAPAVAEPEEEYDAEASAKALVHLLAALDSVVLCTLAPVKVRHSIGGTKALRRMRQALTKKMTGVKLSEHEEMLVANLEKYKADLELLSDEIQISDRKKKELIEVATIYCEETRFKANSAMAFWGAYAGSLVERVTKIIVK